MPTNRRTTFPAASTVAFLLNVLACARAPATPAVTPVPAGLDSGAVERWVAAERRSCRGAFETLSDEGAVATGDSARVFRYFRRVTSVRCTPPA